jgi:hypothetical protein
LALAFLLNMRISISIHFSAHDSFVLLYDWIMNHIFFSYSSVDRNLHLFHNLAIVDSDTKNMNVQILLLTLTLIPLGIYIGVV